MAGIEEKDAAQFIGRALGCLEINRGGGEEEEKESANVWYLGEKDAAKFIGRAL